jgi:predicted MFS family arabinose efflux permease
VSFRDVFAVAEFRALWLAQVLSVLGDQLARVALTVLVYDRTHSPLLAAITYAASIVPAFAGGIALSGLADRLPRRTVMITCDLLRAALVTIMTIPGLAPAALVALLFAVTLAGAPFTAARAAVYPDVLPGDAYVLGTAISLTTYQFAQVLGFAAGGVVAGLFGVRACLIADVATFLGSAVLVRLRVRARPPADTAADRGGIGPADPADGVRMVFANRALRTPMLFGWLAAFYVVPEGVAVPLAAALHGGPATAGLLLASIAAGACAGSLAFTRLFSPARRLRWMGPLAVACGAVLVPIAILPGVASCLAILAASGVFDCYQTAANAAFVTAAPPQRRSQAFGVAQGGMSLGQGGAVILAGAAVHTFAPVAVIAASGAIGAAAATALAAAGRARRQ